MTIHKTFSIKPSEIKKKWLVIDADGLVLGRLASLIAKYLRGKHKPSYTPHMDMGDNVIVVNAEKVELTGKKREDKTYYWHTGYPGGIKSRSAEEILEGKFPERVLVQAVKRMLPDGPLAKKQLSKLKMYYGEKHPHATQNPVAINFSQLNKKNTLKNS